MAKRKIKDVGALETKLTEAQTANAKHKARISELEQQNESLSTELTAAKAEAKALSQGAQAAA